MDQVQKNLLLPAGGIGMAPLVFLMQYASSQHQITLIHGASTVAQLYPKSFQLTAIKEFNLFPSTEYGSMGKKGMATGYST